MNLPGQRDEHDAHPDAERRRRAPQWLRDVVARVEHPRDGRERDPPESLEHQERRLQEAQREPPQTQHRKASGDSDADVERLVAVQRR